MVARAGGYCGAAFKGGRVVTQGDPLYPTTFNVVLDVVVRHWLDVMVQNSGESVDKRVGIIIPYSTRMMAWLHRRTHDGSRVHLVPWSACPIGWA